MSRITKIIMFLVYCAEKEAAKVAAGKKIERKNSEIFLKKDTGLKTTKTAGKKKNYNKKERLGNRLKRLEIIKKE